MTGFTVETYTNKKYVFNKSATYNTGYNMDVLSNKRTERKGLAMINVDNVLHPHLAINWPSHTPNLINTTVHLD